MNKKKIIAFIKKIFHKLLMSYSASFDVRLWIVGAGLLIYVGCILYQSTKTIAVDGDKYQARIDGLVKQNVEIPQLRGMIYSEAGEMIAASLPEYDVFLDFRKADDTFYKTVIDTVGGKEKKIKVRVKLLPQDTIDYYFASNGPAANYLHQLNERKTAAQHARDLKEAFMVRSKRYRVLRAVSYLKYKELCASAPFFSKNKNHIGLFSEERPHRQRPYGENRMASSTIGGVFPTDTFRIIDGVKVNLKGHGRNGLEQTFDSLLAGKPGRGFTRKVRTQRMTIVEEKPVDGADVYTTLDMEMQTILDKELNDQILKLGATGGWAAVMETHTGKIKAISNLRRQGNICTEDYNHFVMDLYDPGSTFKTVSYMVLLDDEKITPETLVNTGNTRENPSSWNYHGKEIRDDHPVGTVTADEAMVQSSNISLAKLTTGAYENNPKRYLELIEKTRIFEDLGLNVEFQGAQRPRNRKVGDATWSKVSLGQISYGYETRIPGMYMLNFYNAIANDGKLMRPYIVSKVVKDGVVVYEREPEVINSSICKKSTLKALRHALEGVVDHGTAQTKWNSNGIYQQGAKSQKLKIAGKTGTAQRYANGSYSGNGHYVSFAGYFPADDPQYTCIVVIDARPGGNFGRPGGGYMAGPVFRNFAEQVYARSCFQSLDELKPDSTNVANLGRYPQAKRGPEYKTQRTISDLNLTKHYDKLGIHTVDTSKPTPGQVPDVMGMGATDALYMLEHAGLRVNLTGKGKVVAQSMPGGSAYTRGQTIAITLE